MRSLPTKMQRMLEYYSELSAQCKHRSKSKIESADLSEDPYFIEEWRESLEIVPEVSWSDMLLYMVSTPSHYTKETVKVRNEFTI